VLACRPMHRTFASRLPGLHECIRNNSLTTWPAGFGAIFEGTTNDLLEVHAPSWPCSRSGTRQSGSLQGGRFTHWRATLRHGPVQEVGPDKAVPSRADDSPIGGPCSVMAPFFAERTDLFRGPDKAGPSRNQTSEGHTSLWPRCSGTRQSAPLRSPI
jgi:hypothetical protein